MAAISSMAKTHALAAPTSKLRRTSGLLISPGRRKENRVRRKEKNEKFYERQVQGNRTSRRWTTIQHITTGSCMCRIVRTKTINAANDME